jgi:hypothetical protein
VQLFRDFGSANLSGKGGDLLFRAANDDRVSNETALRQLRRIDVVPTDTDIAEEQARLDSEAKARAARAPAVPRDDAAEDDDET